MKRIAKLNNNDLTINIDTRGQGITTLMDMLKECKN